MPAINFRVPFPLIEGREDLFIYFRTSDIAELEELYGVGEVFKYFEEFILKGSKPVLLAALEHGLKIDVDGKAVKPDPFPFDPEEPNFVMDEAHTLIMDAFCLQSKGKTYDELYSEYNEMVKTAADSLGKKTREDEDENSPFTGFPVSADTLSSDTGQD